MNHIYRTIWNEKTGICVVVSELAKSKGKKASTGSGEVAGLGQGLGSGVGFTLKAMAAALLMANAAPLYALPTDGVVTAGKATISTSADNVTIKQSSQNVALNWQSFSIGRGEAVQFVQPNSNSVALNRVLGVDPSNILGSLSANGQVFLVNPNGVMFGQGASVNVGGLVASTLNISDRDFMAGEYTFSGSSDAAVFNQGQINADGGYVALLGKNVANNGVISARLGTVALAAGEAITLDMIGDGLLTVGIDQGAVDALVANGGLIQADGGQVLMSAQAAGNLLNTVVNNTGVVQAQTVENRDGVIRLLGDMQTGTVNVAGTLDASAPTGGDGGFIDTSAATVKVDDDIRVTTAAAQGLTGSWLIDPSDYTIAATGGDITGATLSTSLANTDVIIESISGGAGTAGDVNVNDTVSWSANKLTLNAQNDININTEMNASGTASLALEYGQSAVAAGNTSSVNVNAPVNLPAGKNFSTRQGSDGATVNYTVITSLGEVGSTTGNDLQGMNGNLAGNYVLGANIDAAATAEWNSGAGFAPILGSELVDYGFFSYTTTLPFTGIFDGLGHSVSGLTIGQSTLGLAGMFGRTDTTGIIRNVGLVGGSVSGTSVTGALVANNGGSISNSYSTAAVLGHLESSTNVGGLVGSNYGSIVDSYATGVVQGSRSVGGLAGTNGGEATSTTSGTISRSYATGTVTANTNFAGGLAGSNGSASSIVDSYATGSVSGGQNGSGGLVGQNYGSISRSYASGSATNTAGVVGGLVGVNGGSGTITLSYSTGAVSGANNLGGLAGRSHGVNGSISNSYWNTDTSGRATSAGGTGLTSVQMQTASNFAGFNFTTMPGAAGNNWVMVNVDGKLNNAGGALGGTRPMLASEYSTTIRNAHQLQLMSMDVNASYTLGNDIDAAATGTATDIWSSSFIPVGAADTDGVNNSFRGTFDGLGHTIANLTIDRPDLDGAGLFGDASSGSSISNLGLVDVSVTGNNYVGALIGFNSQAAINNSYATGAVTGNEYVGGLMGYAYTGSYINNSYATSTVTGANVVGGLVGANYGTVTNSHAAGAVAASGDNAGGLSGFNNGTISSSYASGTVTAEDSISGGLVGNNQGTVTDSYAIGAVSGKSQAGGLVGADYGTVDRSYATGVVTGETRVGGLLGFGGESSVNNSYATGAVSGGEFVGGLMGYGYKGSVNNSYATGTVTGGEFVGGLLGSGGQISVGNSNATGIVEGNTDTGGLVGYVSYSTIENSHASGAVTGGDRVGGLMGFGRDGSVDNSYATGTVTGTTRVGGLVGHIYGDAIKNSYATGSVEGLSKVGGLVGYSDYGSITNSYATGAVEGDLEVGGLVGASSTGFASNSFWNTDTSNQLSSAGGFGLTTVQMQTASNFIGFNFTTTPGAPGNNWVMVNVDGTLNNAGGALGATRPMLASEYSTTIRNAHQLQLMSMDLGANYTLANNIDAAATGTTADVWLGSFMPVGSTRMVVTSETRFSGSFDGLGHTIDKLTIDRPGLNSVGLFGVTVNSSISNLGLVDVSVTGSNYVGALIGDGHSFINNSYTTGVVSGNLAVGGLVGYDSQSSISSSYSSVAVTGDLWVGGLAGYSRGSIHNSYATGAVTGNTEVGGLVGHGYVGSVNNSYATGAVTGDSQVGGLMGHSIGADVTNSFWNTDTSNQNISAGGFGMTTENMQSLANFSSTTSANGNVNPEWDMANTWILYEGHTSPLLRSFMTELTVTVNDSSKTYDGMAYSGGNGFTYSTTPNGDLFGTLSYSGTSQGVRNAGSYTITGSGLHSHQHGYAIDFAAGVLTVNQAVLTLSSNDVSKNYDGTTAAAGTATVTSGSLLGTDSISGGNFAFTDQNVGSGNKTVTVSGATLTDGNGGGNYAVSYVDNTTSTINPYAISLNGSRVYDGTVDVNADALTIGTLVGGETLALAGTGSVADKHVADGKAITLGSLELADGGNGGLASNYTFTGGSQTLDITPAALTLSTSDVSKVYDGNVTAAGITTITSGSLFDDDAISGGSFVFTNQNVGSGNKSVTVSGVTVTDGNSGSNYDVSYANNTTSTINPYAVSLNGSRVYDGTATVGSGALTIGSLVGSETLALAGSGTVTDKHVADGKSVTLGTLGLVDGSNGGLASNYTFTGGTQSVNITPAALTLSTSDVSKVYDGGLTADGTATVSSGTLFGDDAMSGGSFAFTDKNVGVDNKTVTTSGVSVTDGNSGGNYAVSYADNTTSTINPFAVNLTGNRVYDGTVDVNADALVIDTLVGSETLALAGTGSVADKHVADGKSVTLNSLTLGDGTNGGVASNYTFTGGSQNVDITPAALTLSTRDVSKVYDGGLTAAGSATITAGALFGGDAINGGNFAFTDKNVGAGNKTVTTSGVSVTDGNSGGNYAVSYVDNTTSTINPFAVNLTGSRVYDGTVNVNADALVIGTLVGSETLALAGTGSVTDKHVADGKSVTLDSLALADGNNGGFASNYTFIGGAQAVDITPAALTLSATNVSKVYDGNLSAASDVSFISGSLFGDDSISGGNFTFADKNVGIGNKTVTTSGVTLSDGNSGGNYSVSYVDNTTSTINPFAVNLTGGRVYDGTVDVNADALVIGTLVGSETLALAGTGSVADKHVADGKSVTLNSLTLSNGTNGGLASNYTFSGGSQTIDITPAALTISTSDVSKVYDGNVTAAGTATVTVGTLFDTDTIAGGGFAFSDPNVGIGNKTVSTSNVTLTDGNGGGNYTISYADNTTSTITEIETTPANASDTLLQNARATATSSSSNVREVSSGANPTLPGPSSVVMDTSSLAGLGHILVSEGIRLPSGMQSSGTGDDDAYQNQAN